ncbi:MAG TPA: amidohydrolase [Mucilaginibacter sp.]|jgi:predicted amidohydrolase YtcJ|nr:amidohydrolase [Mucilaginibacter sp.]
MSTILIHNANLLSFHDGFINGSCDTMAVEGNRIKAIGKWDELKSLVQSRTKVIDAGGKTVMPGFNDSHIHIWKVGNLKTYMLDVRPAGSLDEMLDMIRSYHVQNPEVAWITARGFNEAGWKEGRMPDKNDLDKVVKDKPVYLIRTCAHIAVANTKALELSGVTATTPVPQGGVMHMGVDGKPNGVFSETALGMISRYIPAYTKDELKVMIRAARQQLYSLGITAATDPAVDPLLLQAYHEMNAENELVIRLNAIPILLPDGGEKPYNLPEYYSSDWFNINTVKFFSDGGLSGKTAALKQHYKNTREQGVLRLQEQQYVELGIAAMENGLGLATHAIGDAAIEFVVETYSQLSEWFPDMIKRIEHLGLPEERHLEIIAEHRMAASMQTIFISELGKNFRQYLDQDYLDQCYPVRSVLKHGILTALSSDAPVVSNLNPLKGIEAAVTRKDNEGYAIAPDEAISISDALKAYTVSAASIGQTTQFGTLKPGQLADFIILNHDPLKTEPKDLPQIKVEQTFIDGKCVYGA